jgi:hypothetical protein
VGCGPCKEQIPYEKNLVGFLKGTSFVLVNICIISSEDAWREHVIRDEVPGINLFANSNWTKKLEREYGISSYPRYVLVGPDGKVVNGKCPRPSNSQLIPLIQKYILEK